eukprot:UC1_evm1s2025
MGTPKGFQVLAESFKYEIDATRGRNCYMTGIDQGFLNFLYYENKIPTRVLAQPAGSGFVNTLGQYPKESFQYVTESGEVYNQNKIPSPMIHQYDRFPDVIAMTLIGHTSDVWSVALDANIIVSGSSDKTINVWDRKNNYNLIKTLTGHTDEVRSVALDANVIVSGSNDKTIKVWDRNPDGKTLASGSEDKTVRLWDLETKQAITTLEGHTDGVSSVSFSPDGKTLASGSGDKTVRLWDLETKQAIATLEGHTHGVTSVNNCITIWFI